MTVISNLKSPILPYISGDSYNDLDVILFGDWIVTLFELHCELYSISLLRAILCLDFLRIQIHLITTLQSMLSFGSYLPGMSLSIL